MCLSTYVHFNYWFDVVARQLSALDDSDSNLVIAINETAEQWYNLPGSFLKRCHWLNANLTSGHTSKYISCRLEQYYFSWKKVFALKQERFMLWYPIYVVMSIVVAVGAKFIKNTWKSWGLLARALCLLRLRRSGLLLDFPGRFGKAGLPTWPPPSMSASPSSPSSLTAVIKKPGNYLKSILQLSNSLLDQVNCRLITTIHIRHVSFRLIIEVWSRVGRWLISNE